MAAGEDRAAAFVEHARRYAGFALIALDGKVPVERTWQRKAAPAEAEFLAGLWSRLGVHRNMGVVLGRSTPPLAVVEPDTAEAHVLLFALLGGGLPATPTVRSGGKSLHLYFLDDGLGNAERDGLELRAGAQQCVLPPSVHPVTGRAYVWLPGRAPWQVTPLPMPAAVREHFATVATAAKAGPVGEEIREPGRHRALLSLAGSMRHRGLGEAEILAALSETNRLRCKPPLPDAEVVELVRDIVRRYQPASPEPARQQLERQADRLLADLAGGRQSPADELPAERDDRRRQSAPLIVSLLEFLRGAQDDDASWLVDHLAARGALVLVAGLPKVGKSTFVYGLLGALTGPGDTFVSLPAGSTWGLLMTEEPAVTVEEKVDRFGVDEERVFVISKRNMGANRSWPKVVAAAATFCRAHPEVGVCVVDTWDKFVGLSASRSETDTGVIVESIEPLYELLGLGVCVILITHQRKQEGEHGLRVRGGTALTGSVDVIVEIERTPESAGLAKTARVVKIVSRFAGAPDEIAVELGVSGWRSLGTVAAAVTRSRREEILELLAVEPRTAEEVAVAGGLGPSKVKTVRRRLDELAELGLAARLGAGTRGDPRRWTLSDNGRVFLDRFRTADAGGPEGEPHNAISEAENSPSGFQTDKAGVGGPDGCPETVLCHRHPGPHTIEKQVAGLAWLSCGCRVTETQRRPQTADRERSES
jgi:hypothetical protein